MYTLQILDRGQTFLHALDDRQVVIGSGADVDLRLGEEDVVEKHARIEPDGERVRIVALAKMLINGRATQGAELSLGDRIEIGRAVIVVGKAVARKAGPEDVLATPRVSRSRPAKRRNSKLLPVLAAGGLLAVVAVIAVSAGGGDSSVKVELAQAERTLAAGDLDRTAQHIERLRREWSQATDDRLAQLDVTQSHLDGVRAEVQRLTKALLDPADARGYAEWNLELQRIESEGAPPARVAAHIARSSLWDTLLKRPDPTAVPDPGRKQGADVAAAQKPTLQSTPKATPPSSSGANVATAPATAPAAGKNASVALAESRRFAEQRLFAQGIALLLAEIGEATDATVVGQLQAELATQRAAAQQAMNALVEQAKALQQQGKVRDAITVLAGAQHRFPGTAEFAGLTNALHDAETALEAVDQKQRVEVARAASGPVTSTPAAPVVDEAARRATLTTLRTQLDRIREAEGSGAFGDAAKLLREGAEMVRDRDADFAGRLEARAADAELIAVWHTAVAAAVRGGQKVDVPLSSGRIASLKSVEGSTLHGVTLDGEQALCWNDVSPAGVLALADQLHMNGDALLGAATLLYKGGDTAQAESLLAKLLRSDAKQKDAIDRIIARGRGEAWDARGYTLGKDGFVSAAASDTQKQAQKYVARIDALLRSKDKSARSAFVTEVLGQGPSALDALLAAMQKEFEKQVAGLESGVLKKQVAKLDAQRAQLDKARQFAKDLIYDEVKYFYPYKPPAVSSDRFAEYNRVQAEVDRRVFAVEDIWRDDRLRIKIPASLQADLDRLDWVAKVLGDYGRLDAAALAQVDWARALPPGDSIGIADYCVSSAERAELEEWRAIEAYNAVVGKDLPSATRELLKITNAYRLMFRHRPLAVVVKLCNASQGHAEEMSKLGYFAHMSPTPGRTTPFDRMRLAGYDYGVSENIALHDSALGAHNAWCHSSGHHRNLLNPSHKEIGIGCDGRNWVQNFGSGSTYEHDPAFGPGAVRVRPGHR